MKKNRKISQKKFISIRVYCEDYLDIPFSWRGPLTHKRMNEFLVSKGRRLPRRGAFQRISNEDIEQGNYYLVQDEVGQVIPYESQIMSFDHLLSDLNKIKKSVLEQRREEILKEQGLVEFTTGAIIRRGVSDPYAFENMEDLGSILVKNNRVRKLVNRRINH